MNMNIFLGTDTNKQSRFIKKTNKLANTMQKKLGLTGEVSILLKKHNQLCAPAA